jgi:hypothetical protein
MLSNFFIPIKVFIRYFKTKNNIIYPHLILFTFDFNRFFIFIVEVREFCYKFTDFLGETIFAYRYIESCDFHNFIEVINDYKIDRLTGMIKLRLLLSIESIESTIFCIFFVI